MTSSRRSPRRRIAAIVAFGALVLVVPILAPTAGAAGGSRTVSVPDSIDATGGTDVTDVLQDFLIGVPNGSTISFPEGGQYRVEGTLTLRERRGLTIDGNGTTIFATTTGDRSRRHWNVLGGSRLLIRDLVVRGANPNAGVGAEAYVVDLESQHGIQIRGATGVELDNVTVTDVYGDFVYVGSDQDGTWARKIWIHDSNFARNGRQGIAVTAGRDVIIERNSIGDTRRATFDLEPNSTKGGAEDIFILDNEVGPGRLLFLASHGQGPVNNVTISGNRLTGRSMSMSVKAPANARRHGFWVIGNTSSAGSDGTPIGFDKVDEVVVRENRQSVTEVGKAGVGLRDVCGATVVDNDFGPGVQQFAVGGTECGTAKSTDEPEPPSIRGRDPESRAVLPIGPAGASTTAPGATTAPGSTGAPTTPVGTAAGDSGGDGGTDAAVYAIGAALVLTVAVIVVGMVVRARRSRSHRYYRSYE